MTVWNCRLIKYYIFVIKSNTMNFTEFHKDLSKEFGFPSRLSKKIMSFLLKRLKHKLLFGTEVTLWGIGTFVLAVRQPKKFLNLQTGEIQMSRLIFVLKLRVTKSLKEALAKKTVYGYDNSQSKKINKK